MKKSYSSRIISNNKLTENIYEITIEKPKDLEKIFPGQFFNIKAGKDDYPLLRRPISVGITDSKTITFYINKVGKGTERICNKEEGELINFLGPLGNGFDLTIQKKKVLIVGGGIGVAPLLELAKELSSNSEIIIEAILGYKNRPFLDEKFKAFVDELILTSENYETNYKGYVTEPIKEALKNKKYDCIFACGPRVMLKVIKELGEIYNIPTQLLMEERMACGIGACLVCTCKVKKEENNWASVRTCKEGPVFYGEEVIFDE